jgi:class 3 adenylate cyclase
MSEDSFAASPELVAVHARLREAIVHGDRESLTTLFSNQGCTLFIGSDDREWFLGREAIVAYVLSEIEAEDSVPGAVGLRTQHEDVEIQGWQQGSVGWVTQKTVRKRLTGDELLFRATYIFHLESGQWRCVHVHASHGVPNELVMGYSADFEDLAARAFEEPRLAVDQASGGTTTIAFTDIEASTEMVERLGDRRWMDLLHWHDGFVTRSTESHGGKVVKSQGDGFMLAFPSASGALDAALAVQAATSQGFLGQPVRIRIGIHAGDALQERADFFGHAVIVAARVAVQALGGEVLATELVHGLVTGVERFRFSAPRTLSLRGVAEPVAVRSVTVAGSA